MHQFLSYLLASILVSLIASASFCYSKDYVKATNGEWIWICALVLLVFGIVGPIFAAYGHMLFHDEPTLIAVAAAELHGQPLYHSLNASSRYSLLYGPVAYWMYLPPMLAGFKDLRIFQLWVILPLTISGIVMFRIVRGAGSKTGAGYALMPYAAAVLMHSFSEWAMKGDVWILLFCTLQLMAGLEAPVMFAIPLVALTAALIIDVKVTTAVLACIPFIILAQRFGRWTVISTALLTMFFTIAPFMLPGVSFRNYAGWLLASARHGIDPHKLITNFSALLFMAGPLVLLTGFLSIREPGKVLSAFVHYRLLLILVFTACVVAIVTGAKTGAGSWHCAPLAPLFSWMTAAVWPVVARNGLVRAGRPFEATLFLTLTLCETLMGLSIFVLSARLHIQGNPDASKIPGRRIAEDLAEIARLHPNTEIQMGYGGNTTYENTWQRPLLVMMGNQYVLDADHMSELLAAGLPVPAATFDLLSTCTEQLYLIPKGDVPFSLRTLDHESRLVFPPSFQLNFLRHYVRTGESTYFVLWGCKS